VRSTRLVKISYPGAPKTLTETVVASQLRPQRFFFKNTLMNSVSRYTQLVFLD
jgi:hypothetical protein